MAEEYGLFRALRSWWTGANFPVKDWPLINQGMAAGDDIAALRQQNVKLIKQNDQIISLLVQIRNRLK
jgi:hypothetical protein